MPRVPFRNTLLQDSASAESSTDDDDVGSVVGGTAVEPGADDFDSATEESAMECEAARST